MKPFLAYVALALLTLSVFGLWPEIDLVASHFFFDKGGFIGRSGLEKFGRDVFRVTPFVVLALYALLWLLRRLGHWRFWAPSGRAMIFLIATFAIGPGLVVNLSLKDHWHRPRPINTQPFNGPAEFKPWYDDGGACRKNCSFVSGEAASGFWMVAPASLLPSPARGPAMIAAFAFGAGASLLRMAFGGHFLSDVLLGGLVTLIIIEVARMLLWQPGEDPSEPDPGPRRESLSAAEAVEAALGSAVRQPSAGPPSPCAPRAGPLATAASASIKPTARPSGEVAAKRMS